ncbi:MAG TPA: sulfotransferase [Solirubrobacteraceae bacterium]|jgi:hypothetical protein|nr:sulfotransferase [Solirubrobacteraceae bacterium]
MDSSTEPQLRLIGAGLPRTGTLTQKVALEMLGLGPCYHWVDVLADMRRVEQWHRVLDGGARWEEIFDGFHSCTDWPGGFVYAELAEHYPDAKVLLSVRDPERWEPSFRETIWEMSYGESLMSLVSRARAQIDPEWARYQLLVDRMFWIEKGTFAAGREPEQMMAAAVAHNEAVKRTIPPERLLVWSVSDGWEPLCAFLDLPVPDEPLPHVNDRETFLSRVVNGSVTKLAEWNAARGGA